MTQQYKITVSYEEGFSFLVDAPNAELAEDIAKQILDENAHVDIERSTDVQHRDYHVAIIQALKNDQ